MDWALLNTGSSPGDERRMAMQAMRYQAAVESLRRYYRIEKDPQNERALRAFDAKTGAPISPPFLMSTITGVRAWMDRNYPHHKEVD